MFRKFKKDVTFLFTLNVTVDDLDPSALNLVVFNDFVTVKKQGLIEEFFIRGRKKNTSVIYVIQSYYSTRLDMRKKCYYFVFFEIQPREIWQILPEIYVSLTKE